MNEISRFFAERLLSRDPVIASEVALELRRQQTQVELLASENLVSAAVLEVQGTLLASRGSDSHGLPSALAGSAQLERVISLAEDRAKALFEAEHANVQPHSGSHAGHAVMLAHVKPGQTVLRMAPDGDGSTHTLPGSWFNTVHYAVAPDSGLLEAARIQQLAEQHRPAVLVAGGAAYPRPLELAAFREIADSVGAMLVVDMTHIAGLVAAGLHPNPLQHADIVTLPTHRSLRGPRGGVILSQHRQLAEQSNAALFPGRQSGPLMHVIAGKAVAFGEALRPEFASYIRQMLRNTQALAQVLTAGGAALRSGGSDNHLLLLSLSGKAYSVAQAISALARAGISGGQAGNQTAASLCLATSAGTSRGFGTAQYALIGELILTVLDSLQHNPAGDEQLERNVRGKVRDLCHQFPFYPLSESHI